MSLFRVTYLTPVGIQWFNCSSASEPISTDLRRLGYVVITPNGDESKS